MVLVPGVVTIVHIARLGLLGSIYEMFSIASCHDDSLVNCQGRVCSLTVPSARQLDTVGVGCYERLRLTAVKQASDSL